MEEEAGGKVKQAILGNARHNRTEIIIKKGRRERKGFRNRRLEESPSYEINKVLK